MSSGENTENYPSSQTDNNMYVVLMETNEKECESWYYFLKYQGNEKNIKYLHEQIEKVDWYLMEDMSTFDMDIEHLVSAKTAKEMTKIDVNSQSFNRKFDGLLKEVDFEFGKKDSNETKISKVFDILGYGQIQDYISDEDIDEEDLTDCSTNNDMSDSEHESDKNEQPIHKGRGLPPSILNCDLPRFARKKRHR
jgi:hypothetical protein